jgi:hypothetical protein
MNIKTIALILLAFCAQPAWSQAAPAPTPITDSAALTTRLALRDLWVEHIFWIRNYALANQAADRQQAKVAADQVVDATVTKDSKGKQAAVTELTSNAKAIAAFLAGANPNLPEATLVNLLSTHGGHHIAQIDEFAAHDYAGEARTWSMMRTHILALADALTAALVKQFPDKF